ncbi:unnamed protein product, partial [Nesidiocoris tenuis]
MADTAPAWLLTLVGNSSPTRVDGKKPIPKEYVIENSTKVTYGIHWTADKSAPEFVSCREMGYLQQTDSADFIVINKENSQMRSPIPDTGDCEQISRALVTRCSSRNDCSCQSVFTSSGSKLKQRIGANRVELAESYDTFQEKKPFRVRIGYAGVLMSQKMLPSKTMWGAYIKREGTLKKSIKDQRKTNMDPNMLQDLSEAPRDCLWLARRPTMNSMQISMRR